MPAELLNASAVTVAHDVNTSIFSLQWLLRQNILSQDELAENVVISPGFVRIPTARFELLVLPDRIQVRPATDSHRCQTDVLRVLGGIVGTLPHTPFTAVGLNFEYQIGLDAVGSFREWTRLHFAAPLALRLIPADRADACFGAYFSFDVLDMRLKAQFAPVRAPRTDRQAGHERIPTHEVMAAQFNFHRDLTKSPPVTEILEVLGRWDEAAAFASELAHKALHEEA